MKTKYQCKENDNQIMIIHDKENIDEFWFKAEGDDGWVVIGRKDLYSAMHKAANKWLKKLICN